MPACEPKIISNRCERPALVTDFLGLPSFLKMMMIFIHLRLLPGRIDELIACKSL